MIDYRVELLNKRIRNRFRWENILRHENKILLVIQHKVDKERKEMIESQNHSPGECRTVLSPRTWSSAFREDPLATDAEIDLNRSKGMAVRDSQSIGSLED